MLFRSINVGPQPDGRIPAGAVRSLKGIGEWLGQYGEAIYGTRICAPYKKGNIGFTLKEDTVYAIETFGKETDPVGDTVWIPYGGEVRSITGMGDTKVVSFEKGEGGYQVILEKKDYSKAPIARVFRMC